MHLAKTIFQLTSCITTWEGFDKPGREQRGKWHTHDPVREYCGQTISQRTSCITKSQTREKAGGADNDRAVYSILPNNKVRKPSSNSPTNILFDVEHLENVCWKRRGRWHLAATVNESCGESVFPLSSCVTKLQVFHSFSSHLVHYVINVGKPMEGLCGKCLMCNSVKNQCGKAVVKKDLVSHN